MPTQAAHSTAPLSVEDYLALDADSDDRWEFWRGEPIMMAGESENHAIVKDDVVDAVKQRRPDCLTLTAGLRVRAHAYGRAIYAYPDGVMICGLRDYDESLNPPVLLNPTLLIEVTSESTESRDLRDKMEAYFELNSLLEYWIVVPDRAFVQRCCRHEHGILVEFLRGPDAVLQSEALGLEIPLEAIYRRVDLTRPDADNLEESAGPRPG